MHGSRRNANGSAGAWRYRHTPEMRAILAEDACELVADERPRQAARGGKMEAMKKIAHNRAPIPKSLIASTVQWRWRMRPSCPLLPRPVRLC